MRRHAIPWSPLTATATLAATLTLAHALPVEAARHPVYSLTDNRTMAHLTRRGGLYIEAGGPGMARYVHFSRPTPTWKLRMREDGKRVALPVAQAVLEVTLDAQTAQAAKAVHLGIKAPASTVRVTVAGKPSAAIPLKPAWQIVSIPLPAPLKAGENTIRFGFANYGTFAGQKAAGAVEFIQVGGEAPAAADAPTVTSAGVVLPRGSGATWYGYIPQKGAIAVGGDAAGCTVNLHVTADGSSSLRQDLRLDGSEVDLSALGGRFASLTLSANGSCTQATIKRAELLADGPAPARAQAKPPKNVVIWLTDNTRADRYKFHNPKSRVETPVFDEWAKRSTVFRWAFTQGNESRISHASLFTSTYPSVHNMISDKAKLNASFTILPEAVKPSGRATIGIMGNGYIDKFWGFGDGWDFLKNNIHEGGGLSGEALLSDAKKALDKNGQKPFFLYIGTIDSHVSWRAHEPWISKYDAPGYNGPFVKALLDPVLDKIVAGQVKVTERDKTRIWALYDSDISYNDMVFGKMFEDLKKRGVADDTMVVLTSDHGEEFWDHGRIGHGQSLHQELIHVPLLIYYPPMFPAGRVVEEGVDVLDVMPTVCDALGVPIPDAAQGESLIPLAQGIGAGYPRPSIASQYELAHAMQIGKYKLWVGGSGDVRLWDASDLREENDIAAARPIEKRVLTDAMGTWMAFRNQWKKRKWGVASNLKPAFAEELDK